MSLSSREYVLRLLEVSAQSLGLKYTKQTLTSLQTWAINNKAPFLANISIAESPTPINHNLDYITFNIGLYLVVDTSADLTPENKTVLENDANKLIKRFIQLCKSNEDTITTTTSIDTIYREQSYLGMGMGAVIDISLADRDNYCDLFCNTRVIDIDSCES